MLLARHPLHFKNKAVVLTGTGESCWANPLLADSANLKSSAWDLVYHEGKHLMVKHPNRKILGRLLDACIVSGSVAARLLKYLAERSPALFPRSLPALRLRLSGSVRLRPWRSILSAPAGLRARSA